MLNNIENLLKDTSIKELETLQSLWSGYGSIVRYVSLLSNQSFIVKQIQTDNENLRHPRGWNTSTSHQRKLKSYQVELTFYQQYAKQTSELCKVPELIASQTAADGYLLVLQDLDAAGFQMRTKSGDMPTVKLGIRWLANFHAKFMSTNAEHLWQQGGYWHLSTRQDELAAMPNSRLKQAASTLDKQLQQAKFQTLLHGDAKLENMCFNQQNNDVALVDFQYTGKGAGIIDLAYFVGSAFHQPELELYHDDILNDYFLQLKTALDANNTTLNFAELEQEYRQLYPIAWADFHRFLLGWNPNSWKINSYIEAMTEQALKQS
ncbi:MAG: aminoglycoside phosphotransferase family protein [Gammaproteobacteria bacterium]|nr:aminoglycoside phosphotransferase family protein [Gammaproteobacteria bacterium]